MDISSSKPTVRHVTRSGEELLARCKRRYYWGTVYKSTGLEGSTKDPNLQLGIALHSGMETLLRTNGDVEASVVRIRQEVAGLPQDATDLAEALLRGWHRSRWPDFNARWETLTVEEEMRHSLAPNIMLDARADAAVRRRSDGVCFTINWKSTASTWDWTLKWENDIQSWSEATALESHLGVPMAGTLYEGFYKGQKRGGRYVSSLIRGYMKLDAAKVPSYRVKYLKGWDPFDVSTGFPGGIAAWIAWLPPDVIDEHFITSFPVLKNPEVVDQWVKGVVQEQTEIQQMLRDDVPEEDRLVYFRQRFGSHCSYCPFRPACLLQTDVDIMLADGLLVPRVDHHRMEGEP